MQLVIKNPIVNGEEYLGKNKFEGDLRREEIQIKQIPMIQTATKTCLECGHVRVELWFIQGLGFNSEGNW